MATGVKPRDEDFQLNRKDLEVLEDALKDKEFRKLLAEYCEEITDPANQALYQKEMTQLEKERGYDITFINPNPGYVIKTSVAGEKKAFINISSNDHIGKPSYTIKVKNGKKGLDWQVPYSLIPPREDFDKKKSRCVVYDVVFHPNTLALAERKKNFRDMVNKTAIQALQNTHSIILDGKNIRYPKMTYKGMKTAGVIRKADPDFKPDDIDKSDLDDDLLEKLYPQHCYSESETTPKPRNNSKASNKRKNNEIITSQKDDPHSKYTTPKYKIKQQRDIDLQEFTYNRDAKQYTAIPNTIVVEINLPLISHSAECTLDVRERHLSLVCEKPACYKLEVYLPYPVDDKLGNAKFDVSNHMLIVSMPVVMSKVVNKEPLDILDSGMESEANSPSSSDDDFLPKSLVMEVESGLSEVTLEEPKVEKCVRNCAFLDSSLYYNLPQYTFNSLDRILAFTFHIKNVDESTIISDRSGNYIRLKFTSIGAGFVPIHYAVCVKFEKVMKCNSEPTMEVWDNNVIMQVEVDPDTYTSTFQIGLDEDSLKTEHLEMSFESSVAQRSEESCSKDEEKKVDQPFALSVKVTEQKTSVSVISTCSSNSSSENGSLTKERNIVWAESKSTGTKSILRNPASRMARSLSESSVDPRDLASSFDHMSSDCIPEESSFKKSVTFNDNIMKQVYRINSSIVGQKKKNQRRKMKKRNQERRRSESEAEEERAMSDKLQETSKQSTNGSGDISNGDMERRDSGVGAELSDASESEGKKRSSKSSKRNRANREPVTCDSIKHNTDLYDPDKLNKGLYSEVSFKNDLIFDLDM